MLKQTLEHLRRAVPIPSCRAAILFCPALTVERYEAERKPLSRVAKLLGARHRDFVGNQAMIFDWATYRDQIALPALYHLEAIQRTTEARVLPDATFNTFKKALSSREFDVLFIVTHHPKIGDTLHFEFADGAYALREVADNLKTLDESKRVSTVFFTCQSQQVKSGLYGLFPGLESVGYADWNVPLNEGLEFLQYWIAALDGATTLMDAWHKAVKKIIKDHL